MNKEYQYSERIEAYLRNELSAAERADFEHLVSQDPLLYNEFLLQQEIVSGIQDYRKQQLKSRLNQIDVTSSASGVNGNSAAGIVIGGLALVGLLGWWGYAQYRQPEPTSAVTASNGVVLAPVALSEPEPIQTVAQEMEPHARGNTIEKTPAVAPTPAAHKRSASKKHISGDSQPVTLTIPQSESKKDLQEDVPIKKGETETVQRKSVVYSNNPAAHVRLNVIDNTNEKLKLHYYYQNGRIALLGFDKPYTFLDMPAENITYLYYEKNFYKLNLSQATPTPIAQVLITDQSLIDSLQTILNERK